MSEAGPVFFEASFNRSIKVRSRDERLTSDAGAILLREADHRLGLIESLAGRLYDPRDPTMIRYSLAELLRERIYCSILNYSVADDMDRLAHDPALRIAVWDRPGERTLEERLGSQPTQSRLVDILNLKENLEAVRAALPDWIERHFRASGASAVMRATVDVDGLPIVVHGLQEGAAFNGYYGEKVYYPLVAAFSAQGDFDSARLGNGFVHAMLRKGNAAPADGALRFIRATWAKCSSWARILDFRLDAGFTIGPIMDSLKADGIRFVGRLRMNPVLERLASPCVTRPPGRPPSEGYEYTVELGWHKAESWRHYQRLVLCVVDKPDPKTGQLELFPHSFILVTSWDKHEMSADDLLAHYRRRGTFEDRLGELAEAVNAHLSSPTFEENEVLFLLSLLAFNLGSMLRGEIEAVAPSGWDLRRLQTSVLKAGARVVKSGRRLFIDLASAVVLLWTLLSRRIARWKLPENWEAPRGPSRRDWMPPPRHAHLSCVLRL